MKEFGQRDLPTVVNGEISTNFSHVLDSMLRKQGVPNGAYLPPNRTISYYELATSYNCYDGDESSLQTISANAQVSSYQSLSADSGGIHIISSIGSDKNSQACALYKYAEALVDFYCPEKYQQNVKDGLAPPIWLTLTGGWELVDAAKAQRKAHRYPTMVVLTNCVDSSSPARRELARDLLTLYDCSTRVFATASKSPHAVAWDMHLPIDGGLFLLGRGQYA